MVLTVVILWYDAACVFSILQFAGVGNFQGLAVVRSAFLDLEFGVCTTSIHTYLRRKLNISYASGGYML